MILSDIEFNSGNITTIISDFNPNKANGHVLSIHILKICGESICKPLEYIFRTSLYTGSFPTEWKKATVVSINKKDDKQFL